MENDRGNVQHDQAKDNIEPQLVQVARIVRGVDTDKAIERTSVETVLSNESEAYLEGYCEKNCDNAERAEWRVSDAVPASAEMGGYAGGSANEARPAGGRASDETPQQPEDEQRKNRAARPDVPVGVMVVDRPPAECDQPC